MAVKQENETIKSNQSASVPQEVLFGRPADSSMTVGVVSGSELSPLALLAGGVAGMAARRARLQKMKQAGLVGPVSSNGQNKEA